MSRTLLIECSPRRPADGVVVARRLAFKVRGAANHLGVQWEPVVEAPPTFEASIGFDGRAFAAAPVPQVGALEFFLSDRVRAAAALVWKNAVVTIKSAPWPAGPDRPADGAFTTVWTGLADDIAAGQARARVTLLDGGQLLRTPLATVKFGASGDALLDSADAVKDRPAGAVVPLAFGRLLSVEARLVDRANNIWLFAGRPATAVAGFYDGGAALTIGVARANLAALIANVPAAGAVDYVLDSGGKFLARPWSVPVYPFTTDATFGSARAADIASTIVALRAGPAFTAGTVAAFNALQAADCGLYIDDDISTASALDRLFSGLGTVWRLTSAGTIDIARIDWTAPVLTVPAHRRGAPERLRTIVPTARRALGYARNNRVHSEGEIAAILFATDLAYADGTAIEALKPAAAGADVTAAQPVVSRLSSVSGQAAANFVASTGNPYSQIVASGEARDGDTVSFAATLPAVPKVFFLPGGNAATAGQNIAIAAVGLSASGFTMKAKSQAVTVGSTITDGSSTSGGTGEPSRVINRTDSGAPFDGKFTFRFPVTVGLVGGVDPGLIEIAAFVKSGGSWVEVARDTYISSGTYDLVAIPGAVDFGSGAEFGISVTYSEGSGTALTGFTSVKYSLGTTTETSLTPAGASSIPWQAFL